MKTRILIILLSACFGGSANAQIWDEWVNQKATQKKYLLQQIAALQVYIEYAKKGYTIAKDGLDFISDVKDGELNLHKDYFGSLKKVNPTVARYYKIDEIIKLQKNILTYTTQTKSDVKKSGMFQPTETGYITKVYERLYEDCNIILDDLSTVTSSNKLEMSDDERIKRIDELHLKMQDNYTFAISFGNDALMLASSRKKEINDLKTSRTINGIKN